jgi:hypothetical protein
MRPSDNTTTVASKLQTGGRLTRAPRFLSAISV